MYDGTIWTETYQMHERYCGLAPYEMAGTALYYKPLVRNLDAIMMEWWETHSSANYPRLW